mgnify:CR=1
MLVTRAQSVKNLDISTDDICPKFAPLTNEAFVEVFWVSLRHTHLLKHLVRTRTLGGVGTGG